MQPTQPKDLWTNFKNAFCRILDETEREKLVEAWGDIKIKTTFYESELMPAMAAQLGMGFQIERLRCDYTFLDANRVPLIAVEAENCHPTAWKEMESLCSLAAPLKILVLSM